MDDDDLRRGKPACHVVFGEGQAILAGDGLLTEAFSHLVTDTRLSVSQRLDAIKVLSEAAGWRGMVGGQSLDLQETQNNYDKKTTNIAQLKEIHRLKTGALLRASMEMGAIAGNACLECRETLQLAGEAIGLAFQIKDDILDATSNEVAMGKKVGKDQDKGKVTYPLLLGLDVAQNELQLATERAVNLLKTLPNPQSLIALTVFLSGRTV
jgi:geranylgeranyl pyrophosphate synthase